MPNSKQILNATKQDDRVFQLSLTEIAFILIFILLFLLGYLIQQNNVEIQSLTNKVNSYKNIGNKIEALNGVKADLEEMIIKSGVKNLNDTLSKLVDAKSLELEKIKIKKSLEEVDQKLTALEEIKQSIKADLKIDSSRSDQLIKSLEQSKGISKLLKDTLNKDIPPEKEAEEIKAIFNQFKEQNASGANSVTSIRKENSDLKGQIIFLKRKLEANGGRDYPPCWADENTGRVQTLFTINLLADGVEISRAWPDVRESDAMSLPNIENLISGNTVPYSSFPNEMSGIFSLSKQNGCRHYVNLRSQITDAVQSDRARLLIENYFYKIELRR